MLSSLGVRLRGPCDKLGWNWSVLHLAEAWVGDPSQRESEDEIALCKWIFGGENDLFLPHLLHRMACADLLPCKVCISVTVQLRMCHDLQRAAILKAPLSVHCNGVEAYLWKWPPDSAAGVKQSMHVSNVFSAVKAVGFCPKTSDTLIFCHILNLFLTPLITVFFPEDLLTIQTKQ